VALTRSTGHRRVGAARPRLLEPRVELRLEIPRVREMLVGLEGALHIPLQTLGRSLRLRIGRLEEIQPRRSWPQSPGVRGRRAGAPRDPTPSAAAVRRQATSTALPHSTSAPPQRRSVRWRQPVNSRGSRRRPMPAGLGHDRPAPRLSLPQIPLAAPLSRLIVARKMADDHTRQQCCVSGRHLLDRAQAAGSEIPPPCALASALALKRLCS
jgi:hypothetical protein